SVRSPGLRRGVISTVSAAANHQWPVRTRRLGCRGACGLSVSRANLNPRHRGFGTPIDQGLARFGGIEQIVGHPTASKPSRPETITSRLGKDIFVVRAGFA